MRACFQCLLDPSKEEWSHCYRKTPLQTFMYFELTVSGNRVGMWVVQSPLYTCKEFLVWEFWEKKGLS